MYRGTVDGVEYKVEDGLVVVASHFVLFLLRLRQTIDTGTVLIVITMFQIQCHNVCVCHQRGVGGCLSGGERRQGGVLLLDVQEAGQWEVRGGADEGGTEQSTSQEKEE